MSRRGSSSRLRDRVGAGMRVLFVGINPGMQSAAVGHHFAGSSNRFWRLLYDSGLVPRAVTWADDDVMLEWGYGITNLVARPTPGVQDLSLAELRAGRRTLETKVRRWRPEIVALVGVTVYRALFNVQGAMTPGPTGDTLAGARVFVLPNPSGRNAHYSYDEMLAVYRELRSCARGVGRTS